jgi:hypothetical protein
MPTPVSARTARGARRAALAACAGALAVGLAACGGGAKDADPAAAVPATAPLYAEVVLRPDGELKDGADSALKKVLRTDDPAAAIQQALRSGAGHGARLDYAKDVEPWLGRRAGAFFTSIIGGRPDGALVIAQTDAGKARDAIAKEQGKDAAKRSYKDVDYRVSGQTAAGVVEDYVVVGSERGLRTVVDTLQGEGVRTMAKSTEYRKALSAVGDDAALGTAFVSTQGVIDAVARSGGIPTEAIAGLRQAVGQAGGSAGAIKLHADGGAIGIDGATLGATQPAGSAEGDSAAAVAALPGDAWLGLGAAGIGEGLRQALQQSTQVGGVGGVDVTGALTDLQRQLGLDVEKDLLSWMGDGALFVRGSGLADIGGALVVHSTDPAASRRAIGKIARLVKRRSPGTRVRPLRGVRGADDGIALSSADVPMDLLLAVAGDRFVAGVGRQAVEAAISPQSKLADSASFRAAADALGSGVQPTFFLDVASVLKLADGFGAGSDRDLAKVRDVVSRFAAVVAGTGRDGDTRRGALLVTLR